MRRVRASCLPGVNADPGRRCNLIIMQTSTLGWLLLGVFALPVHAAGADSAADSDPGAIRALDTITVSGSRQTLLSAPAGATTEGMDAARIAASVNATDSEDALKYLPSLNVRKRYAGDYDHAVLASRASGSGNSARSLVYADGILLSNLLGNGASYAPRWGLVSPAEIERVDVLYGPFSAAYPGNSVGVVVQYTTRMPTRFEADAKLAVFGQDFAQYGSSATYRGRQAAASLGDRTGDWSWRLHLGRLDSASQPLTYANRLVSSGTPGAGGVPVSGAIADRNPANRDWLILGDGGQMQTGQDDARFKLAYDITPTLAAAYTLGWWRNAAARAASSYLRDPSGVVVTGSADNALVNIGGRQYRLAPADFAPNRGALEHLMHGLMLKNRGDAEWGWELAASRYDYASDQVRTPTGFVTAAAPAGAGSLTDLHGTGWQTFALKLRRRTGAHVLDVGLQSEQYQLRTRVASTADWRNGDALQTTAVFNGNSSLRSLYAQDGWTLAPQWKMTLGGRLEQWRAFGGELGNASGTQVLGERRETRFSPKAALAFSATPEWTLKAAIGSAVRNPTVAELYQGAVVNNVVVNNDPDLRPEKALSSEWTAERELRNGVLRATLFVERMRDALYTQTNVTVVPNITNIQNVDRIKTRGLELAAEASDVGINGLDVSGSLTWTDSVIAANARFPQSVGSQQPRVPRWRASGLLAWRADAHWSASLGARYSGRQFGTLDNGDTNGATYTGFSEFFVADMRLRYRSDRQWSAALGVDSLGNAKYWAFHPYTQRSVIAELAWKW